VGGGGPWSPGTQQVFAVELGAQGLSLLGARTKMRIIAKWSPKVNPLSPRAPISLCWSPGAQNFLARSPGGLKPLGPLIYVS